VQPTTTSKEETVMFASENAPPVVLVVDDDNDVRITVVGILESRGYTVVEAASGREALEILDRDETIGVLFTDVMMPGISGITLAKKALEKRPHLKVVLTSAYMREGPDAQIPVLKKPFHTADLLHAIERETGRQVL
jgi:two-component system cell cycle sensor histidine kinase/response regulator CckA